MVFIDPSTCPFLPLSIHHACCHSFAHTSPLITRDSAILECRPSEPRFGLPWSFSAAPCAPALRSLFSCHLLAPTVPFASWVSATHDCRPSVPCSRLLLVVFGGSLSACTLQPHWLPSLSPHRTVSLPGLCDPRCSPSAPALLFAPPYYPVSLLPSTLRFPFTLVGSLPLFPSISSSQATVPRAACPHTTANNSKIKPRSHRPITPRQRHEMRRRHALLHTRETCAMA